MCIRDSGHGARTSLRSVRTPWPRAKYFPVRPSHLVNKYIVFYLRSGAHGTQFNEQRNKALKISSLTWEQTRAGRSSVVLFPLSLQVIDWLTMNVKIVLERVDAKDPMVEQCKSKWVELCEVILFMIGRLGPSIHAKWFRDVLVRVFALNKLSSYDNSIASSFWNSAEINPFAL